MKFFLFSLFLFFYPPSSFSVEEEVVFNLNKKKQKENVKPKKENPLPLEFRRKSFSYSDDFVVFNEKPASNLKPGTALRVNIPYPVIASFNEEFPVYAVVIYPFKAVISGKIKAVKNTDKALILFDEIILNDETQSIKSFPVFLSGNLKESLLKDIALNFFESLPSVLALALRTQIPQAGIHFINTDLQSKMGKLSIIEKEKRKKQEYLELKDIKLLRVVIK